MPPHPDRTCWVFGSNSALVPRDAAPAAGTRGTGRRGAGPGPRTSSFFSGEVGEVGNVSEEQRSNIKAKQQNSGNPEPRTRLPRGEVCRLQVPPRAVFSSGAVAELPFSPPGPAGGRPRGSCQPRGAGGEGTSQQGAPEGPQPRPAPSPSLSLSLFLPLFQLSTQLAAPNSVWRLQAVCVLPQMGQRIAFS